MDPAVNRRSQLAELGYCVVEDVLNFEALTLARQALDAIAAEERSNGTGFLYNDDKAQRVWLLVAKHAVFRKIATAPPLLGLARDLLKSPPLLSNFSANILYPSGGGMFLHTDQDYVPDEVCLPIAMTAVVALDSMEEENGGTVVIPRSHRMSLRPDWDERVAVPVKAGSALVFDARLWHGNVQNVSAAPRRALLSYYCAPYIRQQENHFASLGMDTMAGYPLALRRLLGFESYNYVGLIGGPDPAEKY
jgi:ectoine hydroxylase-related dioxygenase (phytanoyl-CoA dioxygenase family)